MRFLKLVCQFAASDARFDSIRFDLSDFRDHLSSQDDSNAYVFVHNVSFPSRDTRGKMAGRGEG